MLTEFHFYFEQPVSNTIVNLHEWYTNYDYIKWWILNQSVLPSGGFIKERVSYPCIGTKYIYWLQKKFLAINVSLLKIVKLKDTFSMEFLANWFKRCQTLFVLKCFSFVSKFRLGGALITREKKKDLVTHLINWWPQCLCRSPWLCLGLLKINQSSSKYYFWFLLFTLWTFLL